MPDLSALALFLDTLLEKAAYPAEEDTRYRPSMRTVARLGLAVEADFDVPGWVDANRLDAVFLHRPWKIDDQPLPPEIGVLMSHAPFDHHLTLGVNKRLAAALGLMAWEPLAGSMGHAVGMLGQVCPASTDALQQLLEEVFGGLESAQRGTAGTVMTVAVVNAMTDTLVREAAARGAQVYVTGQVRAPALPAVEETGLGLVAVGHGRCEQWGLRALAGILRERWAGLEVVVHAA